MAIEAEGPVNAPETFDSTVLIFVCKALEEAFKLADTEVALGKLPLTEAAVANLQRAHKHGFLPSSLQCFVGIQIFILYPFYF